jgi:hypothetical protein
MDNFELKTERKKINWKALVWNFLTLVVLLGSCYLANYFLTIFNNPNSPLNPFPPAPLPTSYQTPTYTVTMIQRAATWTPTNTLQPSPSRTKAPTWTLIPKMITPSDTATPTSAGTEPTSAFTSTPMPATAVISHLPSTEYHPDSKCDWMGVAGKVLGADDKALLYQTIQVGGSLDDQEIQSLLEISGGHTAYGPSGFEFVLGDKPIASTETLWIQLFDNNGEPLTNRIFFDTYTDCGQNLVMVVFTKNR